jgi:hypothetical protein
MRWYGVAKALSLLVQRAVSEDPRWTRAVGSTSATPSGPVMVGLARVYVGSRASAVPQR